MTDKEKKLVEKCNITGIKSRHATGKLKECIDNQTEEGLEQARKQLEEDTTTSVWHDKSEKPIMERPLVLVFKGEYENFRRKYRTGCYGCRGNNYPQWIIDCCYSDSFIEKWAYIDDLLKL